MDVFERKGWFFPNRLGTFTSKVGETTGASFLSLPVKGEEIMRVDGSFLWGFVTRAN